MAADTYSAADPETGLQSSWLPLLVIAMAQILMSFNINALPVSIGGIVASFDASPTTVGTAIVTYTLFIAGFVMVGAKLGARLGSRAVFRAMAVLFGAAMAIMALSPVRP